MQLRLTIRRTRYIIQLPAMWLGGADQRFPLIPQAQPSLRCCSCPVSAGEARERTTSLARCNLRAVAAVSIAVACMLIGSASGVARATTGPSNNLPPTYKVSSKFGQRFVGQYILKSV